MAKSKNGDDKVKPKDIAARAAEQMQELLGRQVEGVTGLEKDGDDWKVTLEVLELERVPTTTDVLGSYEVLLDSDGDLTGAQRTRRYARGEAGEG
jgi:hypothetical protein